MLLDDKDYRFFEGFNGDGNLRRKVFFEIFNTSGETHWPPSIPKNCGPNLNLVLCRPSQETFVYSFLSLVSEGVQHPSENDYYAIATICGLAYKTSIIRG